jgi:hypothetical protein
VITEARRTVRRERRRTVDEREAFEAFADAVRDIPADGPQSGVPVGARLATPDAASAARAVREAYERTVMAVPHYCEEYDDTYVESLEGEFGPTVAAAATGPHLTGTAKSGLVDAALNARADRARFVEALDAEDETLRAADERLGEILAEAAELDTEPLADLRFGSLDAIRTRLQTLERHAEAVGADRQAALREQTDDLSLPASAPDLPTYVYQTHEVTYPVLATVARTATTLQHIREDVERSMARV